jgi:O-antigen/teichoic acid export membrane protein
MNFSGVIVSNIAYRFLYVVTNVFITLLMTRLMTVNGYGILSLMIANAAIFNLVSCLGSESGITYHYASDSLPRTKIFTINCFVVLFQLAVFTISEVVYKIISGNYWLITGHDIQFFLWGMVYLFSVTLTDKYTAFFYGSHLYVSFNKIMAIGSLVSLVVFAGLYFFVRAHDVFFYLRLFILTSFFQAVLLLVFFHFNQRQSMLFSPVQKEDWKKFFSYSFVVFITNIIQFLAYRVDYWLVIFYKGEEALGLYSLAVRLSQLFWILPLLFAGVIFPQTADNKIVNYELRVITLVRVTVAILFLGALVAVALARPVIPFLFGKPYERSVEPFIYLLPGIFLFSINILLAAYYAGKKKLQVNFIGSTMCFVIVFVLDLLLIPRYGINGAAIASTIAYSASGLYFIWRFTAFNKTKMSELLFLKSQDVTQMRIFVKHLFIA